MPNFSVDYNDVLFVKLQHEFFSFMDDLHNLSPQEISERAYEKVIKHEILCLCEENNLSQAEAEVLYKMNNSLDAIYNEWQNNEYSMRDMVAKTISDTAKKELEKKSKTTEEKTKIDSLLR